MARRTGQRDQLHGWFDGKTRDGKDARVYVYHTEKGFKIAGSDSSQHPVHPSRTDIDGLQKEAALVYDLTDLVWVVH